MQTRIWKCGSLFVKQQRSEKAFDKISSKSFEDLYSKRGADPFLRYRDFVFPYKEFKFSSVKRELTKLSKNDLADKALSHIIRTVHKSMYSCHKRNKMSLFDFQTEFKNEKYFDSSEWKKFYLNRCEYCSVKDGDILRDTGYMGPSVILSRFSILHKADCVSYLKPALAKRLCGKYLSEFGEVFCPFNGFSGIMLDCAVGCGKKFIGRDISQIQIDESKQIADVVGKLGYRIDVDLAVADVFESSGKYECLFCCPPYNDVEQWNFDESGKCLDRNLDCEKWIDECLVRFDCGRYLFVADEKPLGKYRDNVVETLDNTSHFGENSELVVLIDR